MGRLDGKVAIVTGGAAGFGKATSILWAEEGAKVVVADCDAEGGEATVEEIKAAGGDAVFVKVDVSKAADAQKMAKTAVDTYGKLDILFNNAAILGPRDVRVADITEEDADRLIAVNIKGVILGTKYAIPEMIKSGGGVILTTGSDVAFVGNRGIPVYNATKGAVVAFSMAVAMDYVQDGIRSNTVSPCVGQTPMHACLYDGDVETWQRLVSQIPMGRACQPNDIAYAALFLVSDEAGFITGTNLMVDGGWLAKGL